MRTLINRRLLLSVVLVFSLTACSETSSKTLSAWSVAEGNAPASSATAAAQNSYADVVARVTPAGTGCSHVNTGKAAALTNSGPSRVGRAGIVAGSARDGAVRRPGALHHTVRWLQRGLIPMMPGRADTPVDLVSTEFVAGVIAALLREPLRACRIVHAAAGALLRVYLGRGRGVRLWRLATLAGAQRGRMTKA